MVSKTVRAFVRDAVNLCGDSHCERVYCRSLCWSNNVELLFSYTANYLDLLKRIVHWNSNKSETDSLNPQINCPSERTR